MIRLYPVVDGSGLRALFVSEVEAGAWSRGRYSIADPIELDLEMRVSKARPDPSPAVIPADESRIYGSWYRCIITLDAAARTGWWGFNGRIPHLEPSDLYAAGVPGHFYTTVVGGINGRPYAIAYGPTPEEAIAQGDRFERE